MSASASSSPSPPPPDLQSLLKPFLEKELLEKRTIRATLDVVFYSFDELSDAQFGQLQALVDAKQETIWQIQDVLNDLSTKLERPREKEVARQNMSDAEETKHLLESGGNVREQMKIDLRWEVREELREELTYEIRAELCKQLRHNLRRELRKEWEDEVRDSLLKAKEDMEMERREALELAETEREREVKHRDVTEEWVDTQME